MVQTGGTTKDGKSFTRKYDTNGNYTDTYDNRNEMAFDNEGILISGKSNGVSFKAKTTVDKNGNEVSTRFYADDNNSIEVYKNGKFVSGRAAIYNPDTYIVKHNDDGTITKLYSSGNSDVCKYDKNGNLLSLNNYDNEGKLTSSTEYTYENGNLTLVTQNDKDGNVTGSTKYTYENGNLKTKEELNSENELENKFTYNESSDLVSKDI